MSTRTELRALIAKHTERHVAPDFCTADCLAAALDAALTAQEGDRGGAVREALDEVSDALAELAENFASNVDWSNGRNNYGDNEAWESAARQVREVRDRTTGQAP